MTDVVKMLFNKCHYNRLPESITVGKGVSIKNANFTDNDGYEQNGYTNTLTIFEVIGQLKNGYIVKLGNESLVNEKGIVVFPHNTDIGIIGFENVISTNWGVEPF